MAGFLSKLLENIEFKGNVASTLLKIVVGVAGSAIVGAFIVGQLKMRHLNKLDDIEALAKEGINKTEQLEKRVEEGFEEQNAKIDKIYEDGMAAFEEYRQFNNEQMKLIIDYGDQNKELLKKMLEINSQEKATQIESDLEKAKRETPQDLSISVRPKIGHVTFTDVETGKSQHSVSNAPENYLDTLDLTKHEIISKVRSKKYPNLDLYDFEYRDK